MKRRTMIFIVLPALFAIIIGIVFTLSLPLYSIEPERFSVYRTQYSESDFSIDDVEVKYYTSDELIVHFYVSGGDGSNDLTFSFICHALTF